MMKNIFFFITCLFTLQSFSQKKIVVAQDGSGNFKTVQEAFNAIPVNNKKPIIIFVRNAVYKEKLHLDSSKTFVTLIGEDKFNTILTYDDHTGKVSSNGDTINTRTSRSFLIKANDFTAKNISFQNDAGFTAGQAVAVESDGDKATFFNCRFIGNQDVLFTNNEHSRQYYKNCYVEGTTDFIFGSSTVWFEQCHIHSKKNSHVTAASTPKENMFGYVFNDCVLTGDSAHIYVDPSNPGNVTTAQSGVNFPNDYFVYTYKAAGTYPVTVVSSNVSFTGKDLKKSLVTKTIVLQ